ncbi:hypothetical protein E1200_11195 [Actinomadura sp. GC306]|uniref:hypothetical protein n=1 Tax=Actinomadura sp. GC306 TaxID=2530367 RepID=UPI001047A00B|nr:hypothetical protein [Actinomadura sp. GC306]TDC68561.1 hypothetical protein E1200_11195 [Actinomadura sp. GC306]
MRQIMIVLAAAFVAAVLACAGTVAFVKLSPDGGRDAGRVAGTSAPPSQRPDPSQGEERSSPEPRPTVTVTEPGTVIPEEPDWSDQSAADAEFLALIAADGITAPDDWALEAGRATCGQDYASAREYLTDGGLYDYHVQTFLDDWEATHGGYC